MLEYGVANAMIVTDDIEHLPAEVLDSLDVGDTVIKVSNGGERHTYHVAYQNADRSEIALVYCDVHSIEELYWEKGESGWGDCIKEIKNLDA